MEDTPFKLKTFSLNVDLSLLLFFFCYRFVSISWYPTPQAEIGMCRYVLKICSRTFDVHVTTVHLVLRFASLSFVNVFRARYSCMDLNSGQTTQV